MKYHNEEAFVEDDLQHTNMYFFKVGIDFFF
jgi:hypothetical protein